MLVSIVAELYQYGSVGIIYTLTNILSQTLLQNKFVPMIPTYHSYRLDCVSTKEMGGWLLSLIRSHDASVTAAGLLRLEFQCDDNIEMPLVWITAQTLLHLWGVRSKGKKVEKYATRATLENKISLLRETRHQNEYELIKEMFENNM